MKKNWFHKRPVKFLCLTAAILAAEAAGIPIGTESGLIQAYAEKRPYTAQDGPYVSAQEDTTEGDGPGAEEKIDAEEDVVGVYTAVDGNVIPEEALRDGTVEYRELGSLIHFNNADVQIQSGSSERKRNEYAGIRDGMWTERKDAEAKKEDAKDSGDSTAYAVYASYEEVYKSAVKSYNSMIKKLNKSSSNRGVRTLEKQLTSAAQSLMISYQSIKIQKESLIKTESLYRQLYEEAASGKRAGTVTDIEVQSALSGWNSASLSLNSLEDSETSIYQNLCLLLGLDENDAVEFQTIPDFDLQKLEQMNLEIDTQNALWSNTTIMGTKQSSSDGSSSGTEKKKRTLGEQEEKLKTTMQSLYGEVEQARLSEEAAATGYASAQIVWENAQKSYSLGIISKSQYIQSELRYLQKEGNYKSSKLTLQQTYDTYQWAVKGILDLE